MVGRPADDRANDPGVRLRPAGIGQSESRPGGLESVPADELMRLLAAAGIDGPLVLVGHSYGGMVAQLTAHRHPDRVLGVVLVDSASRPEMEGEWLANDVPWFDGATEVDRPASAIELAAVDDLGAIPLVVLTQGRIDGQLRSSGPGCRTTLATLSTNTVHVVADTGHMIQFEAPDLVKRAVRVWSSSPFAAGPSCRRAVRHSRPSARQLADEGVAHGTFR